ncbi:MAG TPA: hypothetical protein VHP37_15450 [Burkholderiales bacterium]|nr:hypothetical protein [Burkholderiales bacterium]
MTSATLNKEDWRILRRALATSLVMRDLTDDEFRAKILDFEKRGHVSLTVSDESLVVTGNFFLGLPRWEVLRPIALAKPGTVH